MPQHPLVICHFTKIQGLVQTETFAIDKYTWFFLIPKKWLSKVVCRGLETNECLNLKGNENSQKHSKLVISLFVGN